MIAELLHCHWPCQTRRELIFLWASAFLCSWAVIAILFITDNFVDDTVWESLGPRRSTFSSVCEMNRSSFLAQPANSTSVSKVRKGDNRFADLTPPRLISPTEFLFPVRGSCPLWVRVHGHSGKSAFIVDP